MMFQSHIRIPTGTNAILRSDALKELGGLKYGALTEDLHSSMCLASKYGWRGRYVAEPLAVGLAPPNLHSTVHFRLTVYVYVLAVHSDASLATSSSCMYQLYFTYTHQFLLIDIYYFVYINLLL
jgi:cellulose synthase/poly-beta-1,6-N-acetylglucosamine synthase-like glycosyltransferase